MTLPGQKREDLAPGIREAPVGCTAFKTILASTTSYTHAEFSRADVFLISQSFFRFKQDGGASTLQLIFSHLFWGKGPHQSHDHN